MKTPNSKEEDKKKEEGKKERKQEKGHAGGSVKEVTTDNPEAGPPSSIKLRPVFLSSPSCHPGLHT